MGMKTKQYKAEKKKEEKERKGKVATKKPL